MTGSASEHAALLNRRLEQLAADGHWVELAAAILERDALLKRVPAAERKAALLSARRSTDRAQCLADSARSACASELAALKRGRLAAASYRAHHSDRIGRR